MEASPKPPPKALPPGSFLRDMRFTSGRAHVVALGLPRRLLTDAYVRLMGMKWSQLILLFVLGFLGFNILFASLYSLVPESLGDSSGKGESPSPLDAFFFSVQTVATIGYGVLYPKSLYANILVTFEIMAGVIGFAMGNGLMFARFSRPTARIMFSRIAVVAPHNGVPTLMFRAANQRHNLILEAHVKVALTRVEISSEGRAMRRFRDLAIERRDNLSFFLSWTVMHPINESSPLYGLSPEEITGSDISIIVVMNGADESFGQPIYVRHIYAARDIVWGRHFADIIGVTPDGRPTIDYGKFHTLDEPETGAASLQPIEQGSA
jgi:inward rectifier potassium channel